MQNDHYGRLFSVYHLIFALKLRKTFFSQLRGYLAQNSKLIFLIFTVNLYVYIGVFEVAQQRVIVSYDVLAFFHPLETLTDQLETAIEPLELSPY